MPRRGAWSLLDPVRSSIPVLLVLLASGCMQPGPGVVDDDGTTADQTGSGDDTGLDDSGGPPSSDTGIEPSCGNGIVDEGETCDDEAESPTCDADCTEAACGDMRVNAAAGEECDGINLAGATCQVLGFTEGTLACGAGCTYDTRGCVSLPGAPVLELNVSAVKRFDFSWAAVDGASSYRLEESVAPGEPFVQLGADIVGESISLSMPLHLRHEASYRLRACNVDGCTASAAVGVVSSLAEAVGYVKASNTSANDQFGISVALSADGSTLAVGAIEEDSGATGIDGDQANDSVSDSGAVYVFVRDGMGAWSQQAYLKASNPDPDDWFGWSVALSADGNTLAVGATEEDGNGIGIDGDQANDSAAQAGAVYVFVREGAGTWSQAAYVKASNTNQLDHFGHSVALSGDGNTLAVGAIDEDETDWSSGAVYVFAADGMGTWSQAAYLKAPNPDYGDWFGWSVTLSDDGNTLAVGALREDSNATGVDGDQANDSTNASGAVYVFVRDAMGAWSQAAYVKASNTGEDDAFGVSVALSGDGNTLAVGASAEDSSAIGIDGDQADDSAPLSGAVYMFVRDGVGAWAQAAYVKASDASPGIGFGRSVTLSDDGNILAVGAPLESSSATGIGGDQANTTAPTAGAVYVLVRDSEGLWSHRSYIKASNSGQADFFGWKTTLSGDGNTLAVCAYLEDGNATGIDGDQGSEGAQSSGSVYLY